MTNRASRNRDYEEPITIKEERSMEKKTVIEEELDEGEEIEYMGLEEDEPEVEIIEMEEAPEDLKNLVLFEADDITTIEKVIFAAFVQDMSTIGCYYPKDRTILLDMCNALQDTYFYDKGMMFIPGVWYNLIFTIGHEVCHAIQLEAMPELINYDKLPQEYEDMADEYGLELVHAWAETHNRVPELDAMGWLGKQLVMLLNNAYTRNPNITDELDCLRAGAVADLDAVLVRETDEELKKRTIKDAEDGKIGIKMNNKRFLTAYEFSGML